MVQATCVLWTCFAHIITASVAVMSVTYAIIVLGLGLAKNIGNTAYMLDPVVELMVVNGSVPLLIDREGDSRNSDRKWDLRNLIVDRCLLPAVSSENDGMIRGSTAGAPMSTPAQKVWRVAQAIGDLAFPYYTIVLLEIQDTLELPPPERGY
ncbi:hypothetical protein U9M48_034150 [Paspalum notatum var. saurae]|uniref:Uncharacterized protein n=1 Tax=Paspalum notatum var. saurae TaxID=547442 RepID=A0AAQ3U940_PASNO